MTPGEQVNRLLEMVQQRGEMLRRAGGYGDAARLETVIADHLKRFAFREDLAFDWHPLGD